MRNFLVSTALGAGLLVTSAAPAADPPPTMNFLRIYSDSAGASHFSEESLGFDAQNMGGRPGAPSIHKLTGSQEAAFLRIPQGGFEDWHVAPRRWLLIAVQGMSEVTASDGQVRRLSPGMAMLMDDTSGKGHQTRAIGPTDHVALVIPVTEAALPVRTDAKAKAP